jgi:hypothetical protein
MFDGMTWQLDHEQASPDRDDRYLPSRSANNPAASAIDDDNPRADAAHRAASQLNVHQQENNHEHEELYEDPFLRERRSARPDRPPVGNHAASA